MPNNIQALASIDSNLLADVQGGCGGRRRRCHGGCNKTVINNYGAAPAAAPAAAPSGGTAVDVNVGYQQTA